MGQLIIHHIFVINIFSIINFAYNLDGERLIALSLDGEILIAVDQDKAINAVNSLVIVENILIMLIDKNIVANCRIYK